MIKEISILMLALIFILTVCILAQWYITNSTRQIYTSLLPIDAALINEDWETARISYDEAKEKWETTEPKWKLLINHEELRDIEIAFVDMNVLIKQQNQDEAKKELDNLLFYLNHVPENETFNIGNLF